MAYLRDRRAFGNIGTRKFRGARFGDPLSPRGPQYTKEGLILDYSTDVGPFTIIDQSGQDNTATLYSGRGLTMDGVSDLIDFGSPTFSEPVTSVTGYARSTDTSINLGLASATLAGNDTWETFSADTPAKDYGDAQWFNGVDTSITAATPVFPATADFDETFEIYVGNLTAPASYLYYISQVSSSGNNFGLAIAPTTGVITVLIAGIAIQSATSHYGEHITVRLTRVGTTFEMLINGVSEGTYVSANSIDQVATVFGKNATVAGRNVTGLIYGDSVTGTPSGTFVTVGQKRATIPQTADRNWNKYQWFNGVDTYVDCGANLITAYPFEITGTVITTQESGVLSAITTGSSTNSAKYGIEVINSLPVLRCQSSSTGGQQVSGSTSVTDGLPHIIRAVFTSSTSRELFVDGVSVGTDVTAIPFEGSAQVNIGRQYDNSPSNYYEGTVIDININGVAAYTGLGNDPWKDTIGSNDGTESGAFTRELVSASDANDQIDALGTAILEPRRNTQQLNLFGEGEYSSTPDSDSLDVTTEATWELWGNFYGATPSSTQAIISKTRFSGHERTVDITKSSALADNTVNFTASEDGLSSSIFSTTLTVTDKVSQIAFVYDGATQTMVGYIDGVPTAFSATSGTIPTAIFVNTRPVLIGARPSVDPASSFAPFKIGSAKIYNRALTADEVLTNYDTQKSLYLNVFPFTLT